MRAWLCILVLCTAPGCRYEVRFDQGRDGGRDAGGDASESSDAGTDASFDGGPDAPIDPCVTGIELLESLPTPLTSQPTLASSGTGATRRHGLLVPPAARPGASVTALQIVDGLGTVLHSRSLTLDDGAAGPAQTATIHPRRDAPGFLVLAPTRILLLDETGVLETSITLTTPPLPSRQRDADWIDDAQFVFVSSAPTEPLVVLEPATESVRETVVATEGAARVVVTRGGVVVSDAPPSEAVREYDALLTTPTATMTWRDGPLGSRLLGGTITPSRRWLITDREEFRTMTSLFTVDDTGVTMAVGTPERLVGPLVASQDGDLITVVTSEGTITAYDLVTETFISLGRVGEPGFSLVEESDSGFVTITLETRATAPMLVLRCVR